MVAIAQPMQDIGKGFVAPTVKAWLNHAGKARAADNLGFRPEGCRNRRAGNLAVGHGEHPAIAIEPAGDRDEPADMAETIAEFLRQKNCACHGGTVMARLIVRRGAVDQFAALGSNAAQQAGD